MGKDVRITILDAMAKTYNYYKKHDNWISRRGAIDGGEGGLYLDYCYEPDSVKTIFNSVKYGLSQNNSSALPVCEMFDELLKKDEFFQASVNKAYSRSMVSLLQKKPLKDGLVEVLDIYDGVNKTMSTLDSLLEQTPEVPRSGFFKK